MRTRNHQTWVVLQFFCHYIKRACLALQIKLTQIKINRPVYSTFSYLENMINSQKMITLFLIMVFVTCMIHETQATCWDDWSRCSGWSSWMGFLWQNCTNRCKELGKTGGRCELKKNTCALLDTKTEVAFCKCY
jgi:hypothetical protein